MFYACAKLYSIVVYVFGVDVEVIRNVDPSVNIFRNALQGAKSNVLCWECPSNGTPFCGRKMKKNEE